MIYPLLGTSFPAEQWKLTLFFELQNVGLFVSMAHDKLQRFRCELALLLHNKTESISLHKAIEYWEQNLLIEHKYLICQIHLVQFQDK